MGALPITTWLLAHAACAQAAAQDVAPLPPAPPPAWEISSSIFYSHPPDSEDRLTPILYADRGPLHLEARYNYEDLDTLSVFAGWTVGAEGELDVAFTPMLGAAFGNTTGVIPALQIDAGWRGLAWYAELEYLFDLEESDDDFFYAWSTLTFEVTDGLAAGLVSERSQLVDTDYDVQRGLALQLSRGPVGVALYAFNPGSSDDFYAMVSLELFP